MKARAFRRGSVIRAYSPERTTRLTGGSDYNAGEWRMKILIVEDDRTLNDGIALSLGRENVRQA